MSILSPVLGPVLGPYLAAINRAALPQAFAELNLLSPTLDPRITFTRASTKTYYGADGLLHTAAVNEWPLEYDPVTLQPVGRSAWEARTNLCYYSDLIGGSGYWGTTGTVATTTGALYALGLWFSKLEVTTQSSPQLVTSSSSLVASGTALTHTVVVKRDTSSKFEINWFQAGNEGTLTGTWASDTELTILSGGTQGGALVYVSKMLAPGIFKVSITATSNSSTNGCSLRLWPGGRNDLGGVTGVTYFAAAQTEQAATPGPYIPTTTAQVTRAADVATVNALSTVRFNPTSGAFYVEHNAASGVLLLGSGSNTILTSQGPGKIAVSYNASGSSVSYNGAAPVAGPALVFGPDLKLGFAGTAYANNGIKRVRCYPNGANVQAITT